jgi:chaperonin GroES
VGIKKKLNKKTGSAKKSKSTLKTKNSTKKVVAKKVVAKKVVAKKVVAKAITKKTAKKNQTKIKKISKNKSNSKPNSKLMTKNVLKKVTDVKPTDFSEAKGKLKTHKVNTQSPIKNLFTPLDNRMVVEMTAVVTKTPGGLFIPESAIQGQNERGKVLAVGRGHKDKKGKIKPMDVEVGDEILFSQFSASKIFINNTEYLILREQDVLGIVE